MSTSVEDLTSQSNGGRAAGGASQPTSSAMTTSGSGSGLSAKAPSFQPTGSLAHRRSIAEQGNANVFFPLDNGQAYPVNSYFAPAQHAHNLNVNAPSFHFQPRPIIGVSPVAMPVSPMLSTGNVSPFPVPQAFSPSSPFSFANTPVSPGAYSEVSTGTSASATGWGLQSANGNNAQWQNRRNRAPPLANQPLKTFGHNSKPSVSQNPAAFAAALAAQKPKRKVAVRLPVEGGEEASFQHVITEEDDEDGDGSSKQSRINAIRQRWSWRKPLQSVVDLVQEDDVLLQAQSVGSIDESEKQDGLPDFVDIYLPGEGAWEELCELIESQRQEKATDYESEPAPQDWGIGAGDGDGSTFGLSRIDEAEQRNAAHSSTMSLSIPSAGMPFGPSTLSALGLPSPTAKIHEARSHSDTEEGLVQPALGARPTIGRLDSDPLVTSVSPSRSSKAPPSKDKNWKMLGRGFGYDIAEADEEDKTIDALGEGEEVYSDASQDADASESDEDVRSEKAEWLQRRRMISNKPVEAVADASESSDSSDLDDFLSEEYSNPSDEEAARVERRLMRLEEKKARKYGGGNATVLGNRPRADTGDTFASSGLGDVWHGVDDRTRRTSGRSIDVMPRGPLDAAPSVYGTMSRSSTKSTFRADAPVFNPAGADAHFRLPSITNSSFGQSFGHSSRGSTGAGLNAAAPSFVPGAFTFTAPTNAPKLPALQQAPVEVQRDMQGREKRFRHFTAGQNDEEVESDVDVARSPPRLGMSTASVESGLRDGGRSGVFYTPQPFNMSAGVDSSSQAPPQPVHGSFSFQPGASQTMRQSDFTFSLPRPNNAVTIRRPDADKTSPSHARHNLSMLTDSSFDAARTFGGMARGNAATTQQEQRQLLGYDHKEAGATAPIADDDESSTVSDIIEELGERMDRALEGWAGKILDEVTIMGQVRPLNIVTLETAERKLLVESVGREVGDLLADYNDRLHERLVASSMPTSRHFLQTSESDTSTVRPENGSVLGERGLVLRNSTASLRSHAQEDREEETEKRILALQQSLGESREELHRDVRAAIADAVPQALGDAVAQIKSILETERLEAGLVLVDKEDDDEEAQRGGLRIAHSPAAPVELSSESSDLVASLLIGRMQPVLEEVVAKLTSQHQQSITRAVEPMLEDYFAQGKTRSQAEKHDLLQDITEVLDERQKEIQHALTDTVETLQSSIAPHLKELKPDVNVQADLICGRITEILVPLIKGDDRYELSRHNDNDVSHSAVDVAELSTLVVQQLRPILQEREHNQSLFDAGEVDHEALAERVVELMRADETKGSARQRSSTTEIDAVIAFLEPLLQKQDEVRTLSRKALDKQHEVEMTLNALPSAVNTKMEVLLSCNQTLQDGHTEIFKKLQEMVEKAERGEEHEKALFESRLEKKELRTELDRVQQALKIAEEQQQEDVEIRRQNEDLRATQSRTEMQIHGLEDMVATLRIHIERLEHEVHNSREERARERDSAAQSATEMLVRCERAEEQLRTERSRVEVLLDQMRSSEQDVHDAVQRAAKAEGEAAAFEKRVAEQDVKISNLQQLTATQKQKAAQSGQKLSEVEKRLREFEAADRALHIAQVRLKDLEARTAHVEEMERDMRHRVETERTLREEVTGYQARFLDMERDLMSMRETLVGRDELEQSQADLTAAREELAELRGQIVERDRREQDVEQKHTQALIAAAAGAAIATTTTNTTTTTGDTLKPSTSNVSQWTAANRSPSHGSTTWASIYAPNESSSYEEKQFADHSFASPKPNHSILSNNTSRHVECSVDGWWS